jgi:TerC family integral membrane protein
MFEVTPAGWVATFALIVGLLIFDWLVLGRRPREVKLGEAVRWSLLYVGVSVAFGVVFGLINGSSLGAQYFAGYLVELSLSVDNLFVFVIIIASFAVPTAQQPKALTIGITLALVLRGLFIAVGAAVLHLFSVMFLVFGVVLTLTAIQLFRHRDRDPHVEDNLIVVLARRALPVTTTYDGNRLVTRGGGRLLLTPLFLALLAIGTTDLVFAFDSIPAIFGITDHAYIVFAANAFALLGLRPLFFLVSDLLRRLVYLSTGLSLILGFIGVKLILEFAHEQAPSVPELSTAISLAVILAVLAATISASVIKSIHDPERQAHAGALRHGAQPDGAPTRGPSLRDAAVPHENGPSETE